MKFNFWLKWLSTAVTLTFAILTSMQITPLNIVVANISSLMWLLWSYRVREWSLVVVNFGMLLIYFSGLL